MSARTVFAPARVNLIGEHTDYSGGLVLPAALDLGVTLTWRPHADRIRLDSLAFGDSVDLAWDGASEVPPAGWGRYVAAVARLLADRGRPRAGVEGTIASTVPLGAGLSSSAALDVAIGLALCAAADFELPAIELAKVAQQAEHVAVGVPCGLMDPATSLLGRRDHALLLDCGTEEHRPVPLPPGLALVVLDSGIRHALEHSGYAQRRAELERALTALGGRNPSSLTPAQAERDARAAGVDEVALRRLRHVVSENERVRRCVAALEQEGGPEMAEVGEILRDGHRSLREDFEVSIPELDLLVELAYERGAIAARMTGGGFGGSIVALVEHDDAERLVRSVTTAYLARTGRESRGLVCAASDGAGERSQQTFATAG